MRISEKYDHFGLSYRHASRHLAAMGGKKFYLVKLNNAGYQLDSSGAVVDRASSSQRIVFGLNRKCPPGFKLDSWTSTVVLVVFSEEM